MQRIHIEKSEVSQPHYLYDLSIPLPDRRHQRLRFESAMAAATWLGVAPQRVYISRSNKHKIWSEIHNSWFAVRIANLENELI